LPVWLCKIRRSIPTLNFTIYMYKLHYTMTIFRSKLHRRTCCEQGLPCELSRCWPGMLRSVTTAHSERVIVNTSRSAVIEMLRPSLLYFCFIFTKFIIADNIFCPPWQPFFCVKRRLPRAAERTCSLYLPVIPHVSAQSTVLQATCITSVWHIRPPHKSELTFVSYFVCS
jgi:hypothetical protein